MKKSIILLAATTFAVHALMGAEFVRQELRCGKKENFRMQVRKPENFNCRPIESSTVKASFNGKELQLILNMTDSDIFNEAKEDQTSLPKYGDAVTIFLKSRKATWLWEFIVAPNGKRACFFHPGAGRMFYTAGGKFPEFTVQNNIVKGQWQSVISIPVKIFQDKGLNFTPADQWTIMIVRNNYSRFLPEKEVSSYPQSPAGTSNPKYFADLIIK